MEAKDERGWSHEPSALKVPWVDSPFFEAQLEACAASPEWKALARRFREDGFVVLEGWIEPELIDRVLARYAWLFDPASAFDLAPGLDAVMRRDPKRRQDAWRILEAVRELACHPRVLELLHFLYGRAPIPFQTLNFLPGTEQPAHSDAIHFSSIPRGFMCGVWVALEEVTQENGPLLYYPGSHRLPEVGMEQLGLWPSRQDVAAGANYSSYESYARAAVRAAGLHERRLTAAKGTALVWASNLVHGGSPVRAPGSTRRSQVTHFYFEDCLYYAPILSNAALGELRLRRVHDLRSGREIAHTLNGRALESVELANGNHRIGLPGTLRPLGPLARLWRRYGVARPASP